MSWLSFLRQDEKPRPTNILASPQTLSRCYNILALPHRLSTVQAAMFSAKVESTLVLRPRLANSVTQSELRGCSTWRGGGNGEFNLGGEIPGNDSCAR